MVKRQRLTKTSTRTEGARADHYHVQECGHGGAVEFMHVDSAVTFDCRDECNISPPQKNKIVSRGVRREQWPTCHARAVITSMGTCQVERGAGAALMLVSPLECSRAQRLCSWMCHPTVLHFSRQSHSHTRTGGAETLCAPPVGSRYPTDTAQRRAMQCLRWS